MKGTVVCDKGCLKEKDTFGEENLLDDISSVNKRIKMNVHSDNVATVYRLKYDIFKNDIIQLTDEIEMKERMRFIAKIPFFAMLSSKQISSIVRNMYKRIYKSQDIITHEESKTNSLFFVFSGTVQCFKYNDHIRDIKENEMFGEYAFLFNSNRSATLIAYTNTICYQICTYVLIHYLGEDNYKQILIKTICKEAFSHSKYLQLFAEDYYLNKLMQYYSFKTYEEKQIVIQKQIQLTGVNKIIIVITGNLIEYNNNTNVDNDQSYQSSENTNKNIYAGRFQIYCGVPLNKLNSKECYDIIADSQCTTIEIEWTDQLSQLILPQYQNVSSLSNALPLLARLHDIKRMNLLKTCNESKFLEINALIHKERVLDSAIIIKENSPGAKLYFIKKGKVNVFINNNFIRALTANANFGELSLLENIPTTATVKAYGKVSLYSLSKEHFNTVIDNKLIKYFAKQILLYNASSKTLSDFYFCKHLGRGRFGKVSLIHDTKNLYAIKAICRAQAEKHKSLLKYFIQEKNILLQMEHPFIMQLLRTFKNEKFIFYLSEYIHGFVLSTLISKRPSIFISDYYQTQFYLANIFIILDYLNSKRICHRDLKPDNLMVDIETGYLKLIDFGSGTKLNEINITNTLTGTPHYIAPEVLYGKGYGFSCDYWSVGIIAFELYYNYYPFGNSAAEPMEVYEDVMNKELKFPNEENEALNELIQCLLEKEIYKRICNLKQVKEMEMYKEFKWEEVVDMEMQPPKLEGVVIGEKVSELNGYKKKYLDIIDKEDFVTEESESNNVSYENSIETDEHLIETWDQHF